MNWDTKNEKLERKFEFENFMEALGFVNRVAHVSEEMNHHPDLKLHNYRFVTIQLMSHDVQCITDRDTHLAQRIDEIFETEQTGL